MKSKTIRLILKTKLNDWFSSIEDERVRQLAKDNTIVMGGSIASMLLKETVNDYDIYFKNRETALAVAEYYVSRFKVKNKHGINVPIYIDETALDRVKIVIKSAGIASEEGTTEPYQYFETVTPRDDGIAAESYVSSILSDAGEIEDIYDDINEKAQQIEDGPKYRPVFMSSNAITLSHKIQIVLRFFGSPDEILENYDFVHCTNYFKSWDNELILNQDSLEALLSKELRYIGSKYPLCSIMRLRKFINRGWTVNAGQILKAVMQLQELDLTDPKVLEDQLVGVDSAFFSELITKLKEKDPERINTAYLLQIVDRIF